MKFITIILALAILCQPITVESQAPPPKPKWVVQAFCAVVILVAAGTMIYHLVKWCNRIPTTPPPDDPPEPGTTNSVTLYQVEHASSKFVETVPGDAIGCWDISGYPNQHGFDILMGTTIESSNDMTNWMTRYHLLSWSHSQTNDPSMTICMYDINWNRISTRIGSFTNEMMLGELPGRPVESQQFYRLKKPTRFRP